MQTTSVQSASVLVQLNRLYICSLVSHKSSPSARRAPNLPGPICTCIPRCYAPGWGVKCAQIEDTSYGLTPSPAEADTCTSSSVGLIGGPWLCPVSLLCRWCDRAAIGACFPIRVSELICGTWCQGLSMWDAPSGSHSTAHLSVTACLF